MNWYKCQRTLQVFDEDAAEWLTIEEGVYQGYGETARFMLCPCCRKDEWISIEPCQTCLDIGGIPRETYGVFEHCREHMLEVDPDELADYERGYLYEKSNRTR